MLPFNPCNTNINSHRTQRTISGKVTWNWCEISSFLHHVCVQIVKMSVSFSADRQSGTPPTPPGKHWAAAQTPEAVMHIVLRWLQGISALVWGCVSKEVYQVCCFL